MKKISLIGCGNIGKSLGFLLTSRDYVNEIALFDINDKTEGYALDLNQCQSIFNSSIDIKFHKDMENLKGSDVIVITAGIPRKEGMSRDDLIDTNVKVIEEIGKNIVKYCNKETFIICITNPLDIITWKLLEVTKWNPKKLVGMAGVLDSARFNYFLSQELNISPGSVKSLVLGGHGDLMVPYLPYVSIDGVPLSAYIQNGSITQERLEQINHRTQVGGGEIVSKAGQSAYLAPAVSAFKMIDAYKNNSKAIMCCAALIENQFGFDRCVAGVPCVIGSEGVERIVDFPLEEKGLEQFKSSVKSVIDLASKYIK